MRQFNQDIVVTAELFQKSCPQFDVIVDVGNYLLPQEAVPEGATVQAAMTHLGKRQVVFVSPSALTVMQVKRLDWTHGQVPIVTSVDEAKSLLCQS